MFDEQQEVWYGWLQIEGMTLMKMKMVYKLGPDLKNLQLTLGSLGFANQKVDGVWKFEEKSRDDEEPNEPHTHHNLKRISGKHAFPL